MALFRPFTLLRKTSPNSLAAACANQYIFKLFVSKRTRLFIYLLDLSRAQGHVGEQVIRIPY